MCKNVFVFNGNKVHITTPLVSLFLYLDVSVRVDMNFHTLHLNSVRERYCYQHNLLFPDEVGELSHRTICASLAKPYSCNFLLSSGVMCERNFTNSSSLVFHVYFHHNFYMCGDCEFVSKLFIGLRDHSHLGLQGCRACELNSKLNQFYMSNLLIIYNRAS